MWCEFPGIGQFLTLSNRPAQNLYKCVCQLYSHWRETKIRTHSFEVFFYSWNLPKMRPNMVVGILWTSTHTTTPGPGPTYPCTCICPGGNFVIKISLPNELATVQCCEVAIATAADAYRNQISPVEIACSVREKGERRGRKWHENFLIMCNYDYVLT